MNPSNLRVLHIIDSGGLYGAEVVLLNLISEQIEMGLDPAIASIGEKNIGEKPFETEALNSGFRVLKFRMRPGPNYLGALKILRLAHRKGFDLLHSHGYKGNILFSFFPKRFRKIPLVSTLHGWTSTDSFTRMKLYERLDSISLKLIDAVVLVNKSMLTNSKLKNPKGINLYIVNNGIPLLDSCTLTKTSDLLKTASAGLDQSIINFCNSGYIVGSVGRFSEEKGFRYLIKAFHLLNQDNIKLLIIGDGVERNSLEQLIDKLKLNDSVLLPGYRPAAHNYLKYINLFVLPSLTEGLPITLLEAIQAKVPVVATKVGGIPEVLQDGKGGLLIEPRDPESLACAINHIYHNPEHAKHLVSKSYQEVITNYSSETMAMGYLDVYHKVLLHQLNELK